NTLRDLQVARAASARPGVTHLLIGGSVVDKSLGLTTRYATSRMDLLLGGLRGFWQEAQAYYRAWPVGGALIGLVALWPGVGALRTPQASGRAGFVLAAAAWLGSVIFFGIIGLLMNLYVRYSLFALPIVAIGAGALLSRLTRSGRTGALLSLLVLAYFAVEALALWQSRINYALK
ncbi:MAG: hypothetical protein M3014_10510, partial [Chloroflexota bacterium]|nr:hypothetical protein [Chloroflexota bacterium]